MILGTPIQNIIIALAVMQIGVLFLFMLFTTFNFIKNMLDKLDN